MEKHSLLRALFLASIITTAIALSSCRTTRYVPLPEVHQRDSLVTRVNTRVDSIYIDRWHSIQQRADTVYRTDSVYVEKYHYLAKHDTVTTIIRDSVPYPVEVMCPSRRTPLSPFHRGDAPRFYINCTIGFWLFIIGFILIIALRLYLHR